jgi:hypothetical protein
MKILNKSQILTVHKSIDKLNKLSLSRKSNTIICPASTVKEVSSLSTKALEGEIFLHKVLYLEVTARRPLQETS